MLEIKLLFSNLLARMNIIKVASLVRL